MRMWAFSLVHDKSQLARLLPNLLLRKFRTEDIKCELQPPENQVLAIYQITMKDPWCSSEVSWLLSPQLSICIGQLSPQEWMAVKTLISCQRCQRYSLLTLWNWRVNKIEAGAHRSCVTWCNRLPSKHIQTKIHILKLDNTRQYKHMHTKAAGWQSTGNWLFHLKRWGVQICGNDASSRGAKII